MTLPEFLAKKYGTKDSAEIVKLKTDSKDAQQRFGSVVDHQVVNLSLDECQELCKSIDYEMIPGDEDRVIQYTLTNETVDRHGDIVRAKGLDLTNFLRNPVILTFHKYAQYPVGKSIKTWYDKKTNSVKGWVLFFQKEIDEEGLSERAFRFAKAGAMTTGSIGFLSKVVTYPDIEMRKDLNMGEWGVIFEKSELLEYTLCPVPANPDSEQDAVKRGLYTDEDIAAAKQSGVFGKSKFKKMKNLFDEVIKLAKEADGDEEPVIPDDLEKSIVKLELPEELKSLIENTLEAVKEGTETRTAINSLVTTLNCFVEKFDSFMEAVEDLPTKLSAGPAISSESTPKSDDEVIAAALESLNKVTESLRQTGG